MSKIARQVGVAYHKVNTVRVAAGLPTYFYGEVTLICPICDREFQRVPALVRTKNYCSKRCNALAKKKRDSEKLRYGAGWAAVRDEVRARDQICQACGKTPAEEGRALAVHHIKPFRFGGTNSPKNLVALCGSCHKKIETVTEHLLATVSIEITLTDGIPSVIVDGKERHLSQEDGA